MSSHDIENIYRTMKRNAEQAGRYHGEANQARDKGFRRLEHALRDRAMRFDYRVSQALDWLDNLEDARTAKAA